MGGDNVLFFETIKKENLTTEKEWAKIRLSIRFIFLSSFILDILLVKTNRQTT